MNAVLDALAERGIRHLDMPLTPFRIWQALHDVNRAGTPSSPQ
jgi:carbon-monoxide dehydrogenase large subunit